MGLGSGRWPAKRPCRAGAAGRLAGAQHPGRWLQAAPINQPLGASVCSRAHREDVATAEGLGEEAARRLWRDLASAAESGGQGGGHWTRGGVPWHCRETMPPAH